MRLAKKRCQRGMLPVKSIEEKKDCVFIRFSILCMNLFRYSGAGDELISPVYIAPTLPPFVERTWPEEEVTMTTYMYICDGQQKYLSSLF